MIAIENRSINLVSRGVFLASIFFLVTAGAANAAVFSDLYKFTPLTQTNDVGTYTNNDGASPQAALITSGNTLFGAAAAGGTNGTGALFKINTDGTGFADIHEFTDRGTPCGSLALSGGMLYGTTEYGGTNGSGTIFRIGSDGIGFATVYTFSALANTNSAGAYTNEDGANSTAALVISGDTLYGTAANGGTNGAGTVFKVNTNGTGFLVLHTFNYGDGQNPQANLVLSGNRLFGTTEFGGSNGNGTVFALNTDGSGFTNLYSFGPVLNFTNKDGAYAYGGLVLSGGALYGAAFAGGGGGEGTLFVISTNGTGFTTLHTFTPVTSLTNADGAKPTGTLALSGSTLYGTTQLGGGGGAGAVFAIATTGGGFTNLYNFTGVHFSTLLGAYTNADGANPQAGLALADGSLYGTALAGADGARGSVFVLSPGSIPLHIEPGNASAILTWGNPAFTLESTTNLTSSFAPVPASASPYTNSTAASHTFFRLQAFP